MKYIVIKAGGAIPAAILIPELVTHADAVDRSKVEILGAGFYSFNEKGEVVVQGESVSLGVKSRPADAGIIAYSLMMLGVVPAGQVRSANLAEFRLQGAVTNLTLALGADQAKWVELPVGGVAL